MTPNLRVIVTPPQPPKPDYAGIYRRIFIDKLVEVRETGTKQAEMQMIYFGIKGLPISFSEFIRGGFEPQPIPDKEALLGLYDLMRRVEDVISRVTPREFTRIFPIAKTFDGEKYGWKDYYSTMEEIEKIGMDTPIGENVCGLLFDYQNRHVRKFNVAKMMVISDIRKHEGKPGLMEEFMAERGVTPVHVMTDDNGKQFVYDPVKHTSYPVVKPRPRYLKVVKSNLREV